MAKSYTRSTSSKHTIPCLMPPIPTPTKWECKMLCHAGPGDEIKINNAKIKAPINSLISITAKRDANICVFVKVSAYHSLPNANAGISLHQSICTEIGLQSNDQVNVEVVEESRCEIHMLEVTVLDQYLSRGDMWLFKQTFKTFCTYKKKKMDFSSITVTVLTMYDKDGNEMSSGYISENTHCTFRSLSTYTQVFIQISKEMWEYDQEGKENWEHFEKVVYQFVKTLFDKWKTNKANHDLQIIFFSRLHFPEDQFPESKADMIQYDCDGKAYLDIYDVICDGGNMTDLKPSSTTKGEEPKYEVVLRDMKRRFNKLDIIITELKKSHNAQISSSSKGNFLECINIALDQYSNHYKDRVHYRTGQQVLVVTAGSGVFYVDRDLAAFIKHRVLDLGVGADVVCLGRKPLHATPLFVLNKLIKAEKNRFFDRYQVPHWMNMHFFTNYNMSNKFVPCLGIDPEAYINSGTLLPYRGCQPTFEGDLQNMDMRKIEQLCDEYDSTLLTSNLGSTGNMEYQYYMSNEEQANSFSSDGEIHSNSRNDGTLDRRARSHHGNYREANPFKPSDLPRPITNSRRRWAHVFPCAQQPSKTWHGLSRSLRIEQDPKADSVDWQSLIAPACFPTTTDYYPDSHYIYRPENYKEYPSFLDSEDVFADLQEIFIQRLSRGYQLVLREQRDQQPLFIFSLGDTYHEIKVQDNFKDNTGKINITIKIPEKKSLFPGNERKNYKYCLSPFLGKFDNIDDSLVKCQTVLPTREELIISPWNNFDNYILKIVGTEFHDECIRPHDPPPWRSRYAILPRPDVFLIDHDVNNLSHNDQNVVYQFYNILLAMNNIKGQEFGSDCHKKNVSLSIASSITNNNSTSAPNSPSFNVSSDEGNRPRTNTLVDSKAFSFSTSPAVHSAFSSASSVEEDCIKAGNLSESVEKEKNSGYFKFFGQKSKSSDLTLEVQDFKEFRESITSPNNSMKFISESNIGNVKQPPLPPNTFLAYSLIEWLLKNRKFEIDTRTKAVEFCEELLKNNIIEQTLDKDLDRPLFVDGFHFYSLKPEKPSKDKVNPKILFEVTTEESLNRLKSNLLPSIPVDIEIQCAQKQNDRKELFTVEHDSCYDPKHAYGLTLSWDKATAQLIETGFLSKWRLRAERFGFQFIQIPMHPFDRPQKDYARSRMYSANSSPFRAPLNIPVPSVNIVQIRQMLFSFGFLRDFPVGNFSSVEKLKDRVNDYVHLSGIAFVRIKLKRDSSILEWASNPFLGSKKWYPKIFLPGSTKQENFSQMFFEELLTRFRNHIDNYDFSTPGMNPEC